MSIEHPAQWWETAPDKRLRCTLCPRYCTMANGQHGFCYIRKNSNGRLVSLGYGRPSGFGLDPIEKKPLNHFYPGTQILSFGTAGCNLGCKFCQNWHMSHARDLHSETDYYTPEDVIAICQQNKIPSIAFTYNDPVIFGEYVIDISRLAKKAGINTVMVTAGYIDAEARNEVFEYVDAANVDLKGFTELFYAKLTGSHLQPVLDTLRWIKQETNIWLEITTLLIPGYNDANDELNALCKWIVSNLGQDVPLHFTAFHPDYKMQNVQRTPLQTLRAAREIALATGLHYCYIGNEAHKAGHTTFCPNCSNKLITRDHFTIQENKLLHGTCPACNCTIAGVFNN